MSAVRYMSGPSNRPLRCTPVGPDRIHGVARSPGRRTSPPQPSCCSESSDFDETMIPSPSPKINNSPHNTVALHIHQAHRTPRSTYFTAPPAPPFLQLVRSQLKNKVPCASLHIPTFTARYTLVRLQSFGTRLTIATERQPFLALRYESRSSLPHRPLFRFRLKPL
jgi:hypothetical protein